MAAPWGHRAGAPNPRYSFRGTNLHQVAAALPYPRQVIENTNARNISNKWPITRASWRSRGLRRGHAPNCFRLSGIQQLFHAPKFVQWILSHNSPQPGPTRRFPCRPLPAIQGQLSTNMMLATGSPPDVESSDDESSEEHDSDDESSESEESDSDDD
jgi:hypothetical protein